MATASAASPAPEDDLEDFSLDEDVMASMRASFEEEAATSIEAMSNYLSQPNAEGRLIGEPLSAVYEYAHLLKGQGGAYDYWLITDVSQNLCEILRDRKSLGAQGIAVVRHHLEALTVVLTNKILGRGNEIGEQVVARLKELAQSVD